MFSGGRRLPLRLLWLLRLRLLLPPLRLPWLLRLRLLPLLPLLRRRSFRQRLPLRLRQPPRLLLPLQERTRLRLPLLERAP